MVQRVRSQRLQEACRGGEEAMLNEADVHLQLHCPKNHFPVKKSLRELIQRNKVAYWDDLVEQKYASDYEKIFGEEFYPTREDWAGEAYCRRYRRPGEERKKQKEHIEQKAWQNDESREAGSASYVEVGEVKTMAPADIQSTSIKKGTLVLPSVFTDKVKQKRAKSSRDCFVTDERLMAFGQMIEDLTRYPLIQLSMKKTLEKGWVEPQLRFPVEYYEDTYKDVLAFTKEDLDKAQQKLKVKEQAPVQLKIEGKGRDRKKDTASRKVGGGRYMV